MKRYWVQVAYRPTPIRITADGDPTVRGMWVTFTRDEQPVAQFNTTHIVGWVAEQEDSDGE